MGYGTRQRLSGVSIKTFEPDNDANTLYLKGGSYSLTGLIKAAKEHFGPDVMFSDLTIDAEHIHTDCIGYDLYDRADYTDYIIIRR